MSDSHPKTKADFHQLPENLPLGKKLVVTTWILTAVVWGLVGAMQRIALPLPEGVDLSFLPTVNAILNSLVAFFLIGAVIAVAKFNRVDLHKCFINYAVVLSGLFLLCYVTYHITSGEVKYGGEGAIRTVYFILLISHIVLAAISFPFILLALSYAMSNQFVKHRKIVKIAFPMWLYVAITGPVVFLMLKPYY